MIDAVDNVRRTLNDTPGLTSAAISSFSGIPPSRLSATLNGLIPISNADSTKLFRVCSQIKAISEAFGDAPLNWRRVDKIRNLLREIESGRLFIAVIKEAKLEEVV